MLVSGGIQWVLSLTMTGLAQLALDGRSEGGGFDS